MTRRKRKPRPVYEVYIPSLVQIEAGTKEIRERGFVNDYGEQRKPWSAQRINGTPKPYEMPVMHYREFFALLNGDDHET